MPERSEKRSSGAELKSIGQRNAAVKQNHMSRGVKVAIREQIFFQGVKSAAREQTFRQWGVQYLWNGLRARAE